MTPQEIISSVRSTINDLTVEYRYTDSELLGYVNNGLLEIAGLRPDMFVQIGDYVCLQGQSEQVVTFKDVLSVIDVLCIHGGAALTRFDVNTMDRFRPSWRYDAPAQAEQWGKYEGDLLRFFIYPPAPQFTSQTLDIRCIKIPTTLILSDQIEEIPASMLPALMDYVVYRTATKEDEHVSSGRALAAFTSFVGKVKGGTA